MPFNFGIALIASHGFASPCCVCIANTSLLWPNAKHTEDVARLRVFMSVGYEEHVRAIAHPVEEDASYVPEIGGFPLLDGSACAQ